MDWFAASDDAFGPIEARSRSAPFPLDLGSAHAIRIRRLAHARAGGTHAASAKVSADEVYRAHA
jgi:hypothetical protein